GEKAEVVVIVPVHKARNHALACIHSILDNRQSTAHDILVVNDASTDRLLNAKLRELAGRGLFSLATNKRNLGFVGRGNLGLRQAGRADVVLLNSDTVVAGDWLDRLRHHAKSSAEVATVTPFSNNATLCSYPRAFENNVLELELAHFEIDKLCREANWR